MPRFDEPGELDFSQPTTAGMYAHYLGSKDSTAADRAAAEGVIAQADGWQAQAVAVENFKFAGRAAAWAAQQLGIRQAIDIGVGRVQGVAYATVEQCIHQVVPDAVVVACDNDPVVLAHTRALRAGHHPGFPGYDAVFGGDIRRPEDIFTHSAVTSRFTLTEPVLIVLAAVLHFVADDQDPVGVLRRLVEQVPAGSALVFSHVCSTGIAPQTVAAMTSSYNNASESITFRPLEAIEAMLVQAGWRLLAPLADVQDWAPPGGNYDEYDGTPITKVRCVGTVAVSSKGTR